MESIALMFALFLPPPQPFPQNARIVCTCRPEENRDPRDWYWEGKPISLTDSGGWAGRTINPSLVCFGQGKHKRVICGELSGEMEF